MISMNESLWSSLELNNSPHILRVFPNGVSTMASIDFIYGDYIGCIRNDGSINISFYIWSNRTSMAFEAWRVDFHIEAPSEDSTKLTYDMNMCIYDGMHLGDKDYTVMDVSRRIDTVRFERSKLVGIVHAEFSAVQRSVWDTLEVALAFNLLSIITTYIFTMYIASFSVCIEWHGWVFCVLFIGKTLTK